MNDNQFEENESEQDWKSHMKWFRWLCIASLILITINPIIDIIKVVRTQFKTTTQVDSTPQQYVEVDGLICPLYYQDGKYIAECGLEFADPNDIAL